MALNPKEGRWGLSRIVTIASQFPGGDVGYSTAAAEQRLAPVVENYYPPLNGARTAYLLPFALVRLEGTVGTPDANTRLIPPRLLNATLGDLTAAQRNTLRNQLQEWMTGYAFTDWDGTPITKAAFSAAGYTNATPLRQIILDLFGHLGHSDYRAKPALAETHNTEYLDNFSTDPASRWTSRSTSFSWDSANGEMDISHAGSYVLEEYTANTPGSIEHESQVSCAANGSERRVTGAAVRIDGSNLDFYAIDGDNTNDEFRLVRRQGGAVSTLATQAQTIDVAVNTFWTLRIAAAGSAGSNVVLSGWYQAEGLGMGGDPGWIGVDGSPNFTYTDTAANRLDDSTHDACGIGSAAAVSTDYDTRHDYWKSRAISDRSGGSITLTVADSSHSHSAEAPALTQGNVLAVADSLHSHLADNLALTQAHVLAVAEALHDHVTDAPTLTGLGSYEVDSATEHYRTGTTSPQTFSHAAAASRVRGVLVALVHGGSNTDHVSAVSYGGVALSRVIRATDDVGEPGAAEWWFVGSGLGSVQGTQTVSYTPGSTADDFHAVCITLLADEDLEVIDSDSLAGDQADPSVTLQYGGRSAFAFAALYGGGAGPASFVPNANCTTVHTQDLGAWYSDVSRQTTLGSADFTIGGTAVSDDVAFVAVAVAQVAAANLAVADSLHSHLSDNLALTQAHVLAVAEALHAHAAEAPTVSSGATLAVADSLHSHLSDNLALTQAHVLAIAETVHSHLAESVALTQANTLAIADALHAHSAEGITLSLGGALSVGESRHSHFTDNVALTQAHILAIQDARHTHSVENIALTYGLTLAVADSLHSHLSDNVALTQAHVLAVASALHLHASDALALAQQNVLVVSDSLHAHLADIIGLQFGPTDPAPAQRIIVVQAAGRTIYVATASRTIRVATSLRRVMVH